MNSLPQSLSDEAIRVLRDIHEHGLTVLWSFQVPHPTYGNGNKMPSDDWAIANRYLWREWEEMVSIPTVREETVTRRVIRNRQLIQEHAYVNRDGSEYVTEFTVLEHGLPEGTEDKVIQESRDFTQDYNNARTRKWASDWITREDVSGDKYTEEFVGLTDRYLLTDKARELIGVG